LQSASREIHLALALPELRVQFERFVVQPEGSTPQGLSAVLIQDLES